MPTVESDEFFQEQEEHSLIKSRIVADYFWAWASVMIGVQNRFPDKLKRLAYIDLFSGRGKYDNGADATPLMIMRLALDKPELRERLITIFNDKDPKNTAVLEASIKELPGVEHLQYKPQIFCGEVDAVLVEQLEAIRLPPTFLFVDPYGYKGLSLRLINSVLRNWGCDCVFFFNYNRINAGMTHPGVATHLDDLFGKERAARIRHRFAEQSPRANEREAFIVDEMKSALEEMGGKFVLPFRFRDSREKRTTHHLFFVSKNFLGYSIMREIMRKHSHEGEGVAKFEYNPADARLPSLFNLLRPLSDLEDMLLADCESRTFLLQELFEFHSVGKPYVIKEYREILCRMADEGKVVLDSGDKKRKPGTIGKHVRVIFPKRDG